MSKNINEDRINRADVKALFKTAIDVNNNAPEPTGYKKYFKSLQKPKIDITDLQKAWRDANYPLDTDRIHQLLLDQGFNDPEIKKVFTQVFGNDPDDEDSHDVPEQSDTTMRLARYIKKNGLDKEILQFLKQEFDFKESYKIDKLVIEDVRQIFTEIVKEERFGRVELIRQHEQIQLGRSKK